MKSKSFADMRCSIARTLDQVGPWWSLLIVRDAVMGARRFGQFQRSLGIAKHTLSVRLAHMVDNGIMRRVSATDGTPFEEYELTQKGRDLATVLMTLAQWGDAWAEHDEGRTFAITDTASGEEIPRILPRRNDGTPIPPDQLDLKPQAARSAQ